MTYNQDILLIFYLDFVEYYVGAEDMTSAEDHFQHDRDNPYKNSVIIQAYDKNNTELN